MGAVLCSSQIWAPPFVCVFMASILTLEGKPELIPSEISSKLWPVMQTNWMMWIPAQLINFALVPLQYRVLVANMVALAINTYLSWASHRPADPPALQEKEEKLT